MVFNSKTYQYIFFAIVLFYCIVLSQFGFENWDSGFIQGFSWRIINGENVYRDFLYIRPPVSAYFHSIFMAILPENGQYFYTRIVGYILFALQVFFSVSGFDRLYDLKKIGWDKWALMTVCFIVSIHNFFANPWYNNDGIFFASIAFYLMARFRNANAFQLFSIAIFCFLSALTKQSFYFIPIVFFVWIFLDFGWKQTIYFGIALFLLSVSFLVWINSIASIAELLEQVSEHTRASDLLHVGIESYVRCYHNRYLLIAVFLLPVVYLYFKNRKFPNLNLYLKNLSLLVFATAILALFFIDFRLVTVIFFNATLVALLFKINFKWELSRYYFPVIILLVIVWCVGLSLGYPYPILYATGLLLGYLFLMKDELFPMKRYLPFLTIAVSCYAFALNIYAYREEAIWKLDYSLESISPKLKYIRTNHETFEKMTELKSLVDKFGPNYITTPHIPLSHYLFDTKNPIPAEWFTNFELNYKTETFLNLVQQKPIYIFLEKSLLTGEALFLEPTEADKNDFSEFSMEIYRKWKPIAETKHFYVYDSQKN